eukprot:2982316-Prymnesium_polylepis.1
MLCCERRLALGLDASKHRRRHRAEREEAQRAEPELLHALCPLAELQRAPRQALHRAVLRLGRFLRSVDVAAAGAVDEIDVLGPPVARREEAGRREVAARVEDRDGGAATAASERRAHTGVCAMWYG